LIIIIIIIIMPKNGKKRTRSAPKLGDPDYKSATQLRNARKRKKGKEDKTKQQQQASSSGSSSPETTDPSLRYLANPKAAPIVQKAISFFNGNHQDFPVVVGPTAGWRTVAKLAVRGLDGCLRIGLFVPGSHALMEIPQCQAHHPSINSAVQVLQKKCRSLHIKAFDESTGRGNLRHVAINVERSTGKQQMTLVWKDDDNDDKDNEEHTKQQQEQKQQLDDLCDALIRVSNNNDPRLNLHSLWVHTNNAWKHANSIFDREGGWDRRHGPANLVETLDLPQPAPVVKLQFPPQVFRQANLDAFQNIVAKIRSWLHDHHHHHTPCIQNCVELYGGVGTIGLHLVDQIRDSFVSSDENPFNKVCFEVAAKEVKTTAKISYQSKNATQMCVESGRLLAKADLVIVDPPRKGLDGEVVTALCDDSTTTTTSKSLKTLVYVSCGFDAFCRDFERLTTEGNWKLEHAEGHVLFPGSDAIETLAFFTRR
jgi:23S rRNA (uracil1939-C5)-methyltransferase